MRRVLIPSLALGALVLLALACSNRSDSSAPPSADRDAALPPNQPLGASCDPSLDNACAPGSNACAVITCEESSATCAELESDAPCGGDDGGSTLDALIGAACTSTASCPAGEQCAYLVTLGCSAQGICVVPAPPATPEGGAPVACGCDGALVSYVTPLATSAPASSPSACADASSDGGGASD